MSPASNLRVLVAPDKFKHAINASEAAEAIQAGLISAWPDLTVEILPMADGGEGTLNALAGAFPDRRSAVVQDALGRDVEAAFALSNDGSSALVETSQANGLSRLTPAEHNPINTHTFGVGQLILAALESGVERILLGLGGSATNDGGAGMAAALGAKFFDDSGKSLRPTGGDLISLASVDLSELDPRIQQTEFVALCDVQTAMLGDEGAVRKFAVQKGATTKAIPRLERGLFQLAKAVVASGLHADGAKTHTGAAGGLGFGTSAFLGASLVQGAAAVLEYSGFEVKLSDADLVLTGEGSFDAQTAEGKLIAALAARCEGANVPLVVLAGVVEPDVDIPGVTAAFGINPFGHRRQDCLNSTAEYLKATAAKVMRVFATSGR
ncbi:MAG: glycerate kinase [Planctomycetota bacterium]|jgi:glycerate kinase